MDWLNNGQSVKVPVGNYRIEFKELEGFQTPSPIVVGVIKNETTNVNVEYVPVMNNVWYGEKGVYQVSSTFNTYSITISTISNAVSYSQMNYKAMRSACSDSVRGIFGGGSVTIEYITFASNNTAEIFGVLPAAYDYSFSSSNGVFGCFYGYGQYIHRITIATTGNADNYIDAGSLINYGGAAVSNPQMCVFVPGAAANMRYFIYEENATLNTFGNLALPRWYLSGNSNETRGLIAGGGNSGGSSAIRYITFSTLSDSSNFGNLTLARGCPGSCGNGVRAVFGGGSPYLASNILDYVTIDTLGNATLFGYLWVSDSYFAACSGN